MAGHLIYNPPVCGEISELQSPLYSSGRDRPIVRMMRSARRLAFSSAETGEALADAEIRDQCATMSFAGSETTARLMFWASYLLAMDPLQNWPRLRNVPKR